jgi:transposase
MSEYGTMQPWTGNEVAAVNLAGSVQYYVGRGWRVESAPMPGQVVIVQGKRPNHILHLLLSVVTFGMWLPIWAILAITSKETRAVLTSYPDGTVTNSLAIAAAERAAQPWWREHATLVAVAIVVALVIVAANLS